MTKRKRLKTNTSAKCVGYLVNIGLIDTVSCAIGMNVENAVVGAGKDSTLGPTMVMTLTSLMLLATNARGTFALLATKAIGHTLVLSSAQAAKSLFAEIVATRSGTTARNAIVSPAARSNRFVQIAQSLVVRMMSGVGIKLNIYTRIIFVVQKLLNISVNQRKKKVPKVTRERRIMETAMVVATLAEETVSTGLASEITGARADTDKFVNKIEQKTRLNKSLLMYLLVSIPYLSPR